jgi:hypothetical protein
MFDLELVLVMLSNSADKIYKPLKVD